MKYPMSMRVLHWMTALLFIPMLAGGYFWLRTMPSDDPQKLDALMYHMAVGVVVVTLTLIRLVLRWRTAHPENTGLALWVHRTFYALIFLMPVSGFEPPRVYRRPISPCYATISSVFRFA